MKAITLATLLLATPALAEPALHIDTRSLVPGTNFKLTFDKAVVEDAQVGKETTSALLHIDPPLAGTLLWEQANVAVFKRTGVPALKTKYTFSIAEGQSYRDGSEIPVKELQNLSTSPFVYEYGYWVGTTREPLYFVRFNDAVDPKTAAKHIYFIDKEGNKVAAQARRGKYGDLSASRSLGPTWKERFQGWARPKGEIAADTEIASALTITPVSPLPIGESWKVYLDHGIPNADGSAKLTKVTQRWIGSVRPFEVASVQAVTRLDSPRYISIGLSKHLPDGVTAQDIAPYLAIDPVPANMELEAKNSLISIKGNFGARSSWKVTVKSGLQADDGLAMTESTSESVSFKHLEPTLATPSYSAAQLSLGSRTYPIETTNLASVRVRIKRLEGPAAIRTLQGYRHYSGIGPNRRWFSKRHPLPWSLVVGKPIHDRTITIEGEHDTSHPIELNWSEILGGEDRNATLFVSLEGKPKSGMERAFRATRLTQVYLQLTDIGLAWKINEDAAFVYAYSCDTGKPLANVSLQLFAEDASPLQEAVTDAQGIARLPRDVKQRHLRASLGDDTLIVAFDEHLPTVDMWRFPVEGSSGPANPDVRTAYLFTDRTLYRPGEEVHLKGLVRRIKNNRSVFETAQGAQLVVRDSRSRTLIERDITLSSQGSFDYSFRLPAETVGFFRLELRWPGDIERASKEKDRSLRRALYAGSRFSHTINVQEFRRNAFEVKGEFAPLENGQPLALDLRASYFQGQPVARGGIEWFYYSQETGFYPDRYRDFLFCDHRVYDPHYWSTYFGYGEDDHSRTYESENGEATLNDEGQARLEFDLEEISFPTPRKITVSSEIMDERNQTIAHSSSTTIHSSDIYLGVSRVDELTRVDSPLDLRAVAVTSEGKPSDQPLVTTVRIEREVHEQIKTKTDKGTIAVRNEKRLELVEERTFTIEATQNDGRGTAFTFTPRKSGKHILTFSAKDAAGKETRTAVIHRVYGTKEYPWAYENGMLIKLVPEKKRYNPGDTARVLVLSPIEGTALVTLEREGVHRHFITDLKADNPILEIPVSNDEAPNTYVSVLVIKGSQDNLRKHKQPILRLGYCELKVANRDERLAVALDVPGDYHRPGEEVRVEGVVRDFKGAPVSNAEVTLYAEDEGVLSVAGYHNPDPLAHFYAPRPLRTEAGSSLRLVLSENPEQQHTFNKGFFVGDKGGDSVTEGPALRLRKDFNPCAIWAPSLTTNEQGEFNVTFTSPDSLTRYRVIAVAHQGAERFGSQTTEFVVNKPLMLEPSVPRFAHEGDRLQPKVVVQNATAYEGTWEVGLKVGSLTEFVEGGDREQRRTVTIPAHGNAALTFDLRFVGTGSVDWQWSARPVLLEGNDLDPVLLKRLSDAVHSKFEVDYPMPLLSETHFVKFNDPTAGRNLLEGLPKHLLEGRGNLHLEFGRSALLEAGDAFEYLLKYPYGCLEQTTSSTMPWIAALELRDHLPTFNTHTEKDIRKSIQAGADRLLSMQCRDGGLAYWPGNRESTPWASSYGGMALVLCQKAGAEVPQTALSRLQSFLTKQLRGLAKTEDWWELENACRTCYTLSLAGAPQVSYHNKLQEDLERLSPNALSFLALAVFHSEAENAAATARTILEKRGTVSQKDGHFLHHHPKTAYRLLALATIDPDSTECAETLDRLMQHRQRSGHWGSTWSNAWTIYAMAQYARDVEAQSAPPIITFTTDTKKEEFTLDDKQRSKTVTLPLHAGLRADAQGPKGAIARIKISSKPRIAPTQAVAKNGLQILRTYYREHPDGTTEILKQPKVGDLVRVELQVTMPRDGTRYLVVDDPLPSLFETVNTQFASQAGRLAKGNYWNPNYKELRDDRALFFINHVARAGVYKLSYHARVTSAGEATAPPAKVEAMYEPEFYALSPSRRLTTPPPTETAGR